MSEPTSKLAIHLKVRLPPEHPSQKGTTIANPSPIQTPRNLVVPLALSIAVSTEEKMAAERLGSILRHIAPGGAVSQM